MSAARLFVLTLVAFTGLAPHAAAPVGASRPALPGTIALGARAADPEGGDGWVVRTWRRGLTAFERE